MLMAMEMPPAAEIKGVINLDKPAGMSSAYAVGGVKRLLPRGVKIGHAGTLDPFATGVLVILIGKATRLSEAFMNAGKQYTATCKLGATTETLDPDTPEQLVADAPIPALDAVQCAVGRWVGIVEQMPPDYSALKIGGRPAYRLARKGEPVPLESRRVRIDAIELVSYEYPLLDLRIDCGKGVYIRALARDIGVQLGSAGYLTRLRRTRVGRLDDATSVTLERLNIDGVGAHLLPPDLP